MNMKKLNKSSTYFQYTIESGVYFVREQKEEEPKPNQLKQLK